LDCDPKLICIYLFSELKKQGTSKKYEGEAAFAVIPTNNQKSARVCCPKDKNCICDLYTALTMEDINDGKKYTIKGNGAIDIPEGITQFTCYLESLASPSKTK
jgi:hypothetical protein